MREELLVDLLEGEIDGGPAALQVEGRVEPRGHEHADVVVGHVAGQCGAEEGREQRQRQGRHVARRQRGYC